MRSVLRVALALLLLNGLPAIAADGLYLGAGIGVATVRDDIETGGTFDADDGSYRAFAGWRWDAVPLVDLALEAAYTEFGKPSQNVAGQEARYKLRGPSAAGLLILPLGPFDLYGKAGFLWWSLDRDLGASSLSRSGSDPFFGAGVGFYLWKIGIRAEYERFQIKDVDRVEMISVNALCQF
jgi:OOP family OmpA-OmpF porin